MNNNDLSTEAQKAKVEANYLKSIELLGAQIKQSYNEASKIKLPASFKGVNKIITCGMGGSQLGAELIKQLFSDKLNVPILQIHDYHLPKYADNNSLILLLSYSGTTEEVLTILNEAKKRTKKIIVITVGGGLAQAAQKNNWPLYQFNPINNPSNQPRMGTGYMIGSVLAFLQKLNLVKLASSEITEVIKSAAVSQLLKNQAKKIAKSLQNKVPVIITAEHLQANAHIMANQINESAKQRCYFFALPELNHHLLEGLEFPREGKKHLSFVFLFSKNYYSRNQKRFKITQDVLKKQKLSCQLLDLKGSKVNESLQVLALGSLLSYELSKINKVDPNKIIWVNYFKQKMHE